MSNGATPIHVTITPTGGGGGNIPISAAGTHPYVQPNGDIRNLQAGQAYDITFTLAAAHGVDSWDPAAPFGTQPGGSCPPPGQGASGPFRLQPGGVPTSMTIHVDGQPQDTRTEYRLNYNDGQSTDPIIVVG